jgi:Cu+-exporting ATPase
MICDFLEADEKLFVEKFEEIKGDGIVATINNQLVKIGSANFIFNANTPQRATTVHVEVNHFYLGHFEFVNQYRKNINNAINDLQLMNYELHVLSGDNDSEKNNLQKLFGEKTVLKFNQSPQDKLRYIEHLQQNKNRKVLMLGDGLNDAGALMQSDVGIAITDNTALFTPACDAILDGNKLEKIAAFMHYAKSEKKIVATSFGLSILYNIIGELFAVSSNLSPMVAAILMPLSSISIVLFVTAASTFSARIMKL